MLMILLSVYKSSNMHAYNYYLVDQNSRPICQRYT